MGNISVAKSRPQPPFVAFILRDAGWAAPENDGIIGFAHIVGEPSLIASAVQPQTEATPRSRKPKQRRAGAPFAICSSGGGALRI
jgi:hypothetical protein